MPAEVILKPIKTSIRNFFPKYTHADTEKLLVTLLWQETEAVKHGYLLSRLCAVKHGYLNLVS